MNWLKQKPSVAVGLVLIVSAFLIGRCSTGADKSVIDPEGNTDISMLVTGEGDMRETSLLPDKPVVWTCSMHPQIHQHEAGQCPICGMDLIPLAETEEPVSGAPTLSLSDRAAALAEIETTVVEQRYPEAKIRLVGQLGYDETRVKSLAARFPARIDRLFVNFNGVVVQQGEHLAQVFSPELLSAMSDLLGAVRANPKSIAARAAKEKLRRWDLLPSQIDQIIKKK